MTEGRSGQDQPGKHGRVAVRPPLSQAADAATGAAARLCRMLEDRKRAVVAGFLTRQASLELCFGLDFRQEIL
jgi:hypothetical protein